MKKRLQQCLDGLRDGRWVTIDRIRGYALLLVIAYSLAVGIWISMAHGLRDHAGHPLGTDFLNVYAAGLMTNSGHAVDAYDWEKHGMVEHQVVGFNASYYGWHYPPMFLGLAALLALLPYGWALSCYLIAGFSAYIAAIKRIAPPYKLTFLAAAAFPGVFINIGNGQNGFITTALLAAGFSYIETQPFVAGILLGLLAYKPQFFVLIPLALLVGRFYRAFIATCGMALATLALPYAILGGSIWQAFFASMHLTQGIILEQGSTGWSKIQSVFSMVRMWGGDIKTAYSLHAIVALAVLIPFVKIWRMPSTLATRVAALVATALLFTPYVLDYDLMVLAVPIAFLARQGCENGFRPYEKTLLVVIWVLPFIARLIGEHGLIITPFILMALLALCYCHNDQDNLHTNDRLRS